MPAITLKEEKTKLRGQAKALRDQLPVEERVQASQQICRNIGALQVVSEARAIALYWPMGSEVDTRPLWTKWPEKQIYAPFMRKRGALPPEMGLSAIDSPEDLSLFEFGFRQPARDSQAARGNEVDLIIAPGLLFTLRGQRLGYGAGFYDRILQSFAPNARSLFVSFEQQLVEALPIEPHDHRANFLVTDKRCLSF